MDVNCNEWSQHEFIHKMTIDCKDRNDTICNKTGYACKDYLCPIVKLAEDISEVRSMFEWQKK